MPYAYDRAFALPFPVLPVRLRSITGATASPVVSSMLNTGADATLVPMGLLQSLQLNEIYIARLRSHWGDLRTARVYLVDLEIGDQVLPSIKVLGDEQGSSILLGRNVLNKLILLLDGPQSETEILAHRPKTARKR